MISREGERERGFQKKITDTSDETIETMSI